MFSNGYALVVLPFVSGTTKVNKSDNRFKITGEEKEEVVDMCRAWENSINDAKNEGRREGKLEGRREGELEGRREGKLEGKIETLYEECDMSIPDIAKKVSKPEEYVKEVIKKLTAACL